MFIIDRDRGTTKIFPVCNTVSYCIFRLKYFDCAVCDLRPKMTAAETGRQDRLCLQLFSRLSLKISSPVNQE